MRRTILYLFAVALSVRILIALVRAGHGLTLDSPWLEGKDDFDGIYVAQLAQLRQGATPYESVAISYPPLFLYFLYPFYLLGGANFAALPIVATDAATAVVIFYAVERLSQERLAFAAGLGYALSPFALYYEGYVWFSSQPMAFFGLLGLCLILRERPVLSLLSIAVAILFKQEAVFLLPIVFVLLARQNTNAIAKAATTFLVTLAGVSAPFLAASGESYLSLVSYGLLGRWQGQPPPEQVESSQACHNVFVSSSSTLMSCSSGSTSFYQIVNNSLPQSALFLNALSYDLEVIAGIVAVPIFLLLGVALYALRRHRAIAPLACAYTGAGFLILFSVVFHPVFRYYYLPVYGLLFMSIVNKQTLAVAIAAPIASLLTPSGLFQELVPLVAILALALLLDRDSLTLGSNASELNSSSAYVHPGSDGN